MSMLTRRWRLGFDGMLFQLERMGMLCIARHYYYMEIGGWQGSGGHSCDARS